METRIRRVRSMLKRYPAAYHAIKPAYRAARHAYTAANTAQALVRRPYQIRKYFRSAGDFTGLQIGAGNNQLAGWLKTDLEPDLKTVYMDAAKRFPFADGTFNYIVAEHIIEHLPYEEALNMLSECHRVLKNGGVVRISTPNIELTHQLMHLPLTPTLERYVSFFNRRFGSTDNLNSAIHVINRLQHDWGHQFLYDVDTLVASLRQSGFGKIAECAPDKSNHAALTNVDCHGMEIDEEFNELFNELEVLIVEAIK